jgi:hypothetical protein
MGFGDHRKINRINQIVSLAIIALKGFHCSTYKLNLAGTLNLYLQKNIFELIQLQCFTAPEIEGAIDNAGKRRVMLSVTGNAI